MIPKVLAAVLAVAVRSVGGYTYWHYSGGHCCPLQAAANQLSTGDQPAETPSCCQQPSRTDCVNLSTADGCCQDVVMTDLPAPEVLDIPPREVK